MVKMRLINMRTISNKILMLKQKLLKIKMKDRVTVSTMTGQRRKKNLRHQKKIEKRKKHDLRKRGSNLECSRSK